MSWPIAGGTAPTGDPDEPPTAAELALFLAEHPEQIQGVSTKVIAGQTFTMADPPAMVAFVRWLVQTGRRAAGVAERFLAWSRSLHKMIGRPWPEG